MNTAEKIRDIFYSGNYAFSGESEPINEIAFLVDEEYLSLASSVIADKQEYLRVAQEISERAHMFDAAAGGGHSHMALKIIAQRFLRKQRNKEAIFEHPFCGYYPDVISIDKTIVVECGHTQNPTKMLDYFQEGNILEYIQVPYPTVDDQSVTGFIFTAGSALSEFLTFLNEQKRNKFREIVRRRKQPKKGAQIDL